MTSTVSPTWPEGRPSLPPILSEAFRVSAPIRRQTLTRLSSHEGLNSTNTTRPDLSG
jgi:hypothetical protein